MRLKLRKNDVPGRYECHTKDSQKKKTFREHQNFFTFKKQTRSEDQRFVGRNFLSIKGEPSRTRAL